MGGGGGRGGGTLLKRHSLDVSCIFYDSMEVWYQVSVKLLASSSTIMSGVKVRLV